MARKHVRSSSSGRTVLLVDDDLEYLTATERLLTRDGHTVIVASSGPQGLEILRQRGALS